MTQKGLAENPEGRCVGLAPLEDGVGERELVRIVSAHCP